MLLSDVSTIGAPKVAPKVRVLLAAATFSIVSQSVALNCFPGVEVVQVQPPYLSY